MNRAEETAGKLALATELLEKNQAIRLRGIDWFAWATAGGSSAVLLAAETGIAEMIITPSGAWVVTDDIEAERLRDEELPPGLGVHVSPWASPDDREAFIHHVVGGGTILSDRPLAGELPLPAGLIAAKRTMISPEVERYREVGRFAAEAMTEALRAAQPSWTEWELAAAGARALLCRGVEPALVLAAGAERLFLYRHPIPSRRLLGTTAMLVFCARRYGLYANLTRFISFGKLEPAVAALHRQVYEIEGEALGASQPGVSLSEVYEALAGAYATAGHPTAIHEHHQGGTTGYLSREVVALPESTERLRENTPIAWNPSLRGAKVEDTFLVTSQGLKNLTMDPAWPTLTVSGMERPLVMEREQG